MVRARRLSPQTIAVLGALSAHEWRHGYDLCTSLDLRAGTVYPILLRLADRGLVETTWEDAPPRGRPPRHLYRLTGSGVVAVESVARDGATARGREPGLAT
jgi:DNA-binding PadR family transcriptional regulator